jgi:hypothetical protein
MPETISRTSRLFGALCASTRSTSRDCWAIRPSSRHKIWGQRSAVTAKVALAGGANMIGRESCRLTLNASLTRASFARFEENSCASAKFLTYFCDSLAECW